MVRLNVPKQQKNARKRGMMGMSNQLRGITHFSDITALTGGEGAQVSSSRNFKHCRCGGGRGSLHTSLMRNCSAVRTVKSSRAQKI